MEISVRLSRNLQILISTANGITRKYFLKQRNYEIPFDTKIAPGTGTMGAKKYRGRRIGDMERESEKGGRG